MAKRDKATQNETTLIPFSQRPEIDISTIDDLEKILIHEDPYISYDEFFTHRKNLVKILNLSHIKISEEDFPIFAFQLESILKYLKKLSNVDTKNVKETSQVTGLENVIRNDKTTFSLSSKDALANAKSVEDNLFSVKAVFEQDEH